MPMPTLSAEKAVRQRLPLGVRVGLLSVSLGTNPKRVSSQKPSDLPMVYRSQMQNGVIWGRWGGVVEGTLFGFALKGNRKQHRKIHSFGGYPSTCVSQNSGRPKNGWYPWFSFCMQPTRGFSALCFFNRTYIYMCIYARGS